MEEMKNNLSSKKGQFADRKKKRIDYLDEKRDTRDNMLTDKREEQDARRNAWYEKLEAAADTSEKKAAVIEFKKTVEAAVETRRDAIDTALSAFRKSVDAAVTTQKENRAGGIDTFEAIVEVAISQAKNFGEIVPLTGVVLTKLDGTAKGGVVLSVHEELHVPIKWIGLGEREDDLDRFHPDDFAKALFETEDHILGESTKV